MDINFGLKIKELMEFRGDDVKSLAAGLNYSSMGLYKILEKEDVSTEILKKVCKYYGISMTYFLSENVNIRQSGKVNSVGENTVYYGNRINSNLEDKQRIELLTSKLEGAEKEISLLKKMISILEKQSN